jgi:phosphate transport system permease protein
MSAIASGSTGSAGAAVPDFTAPLTATGNLRRRQAVSRVVDVGAGGSAVIAVAVLAIVVFSVIQQGASAISPGFVVHNPSVSGIGGGVASALVGSALIVAAATLMAAPIGVLTALYLTELAGPRSGPGRTLRMALNVMQGLPTIVVGIFIYGAIVIPDGESGFAGSLALAIIMVPLIARSSQEVLLQVPGALREAGDALGVNRWHTILGVILPSAAGGIVTGTILAVARAAGETAPLFLTDPLSDPSHTSLNLFGPMPNVPVRIFELSEQPQPAGIAEAWGAALFLVAIILLANIGARMLLARSRRKMGR